MDAEPDVAARFRAARRRDWVLVGQSHLLALPISILAFTGLCWANQSPPFVLVPHYFYWLVGAVLAAWPLCYFAVVGMLLLPTFIYRWLCYYRHAGTSSLLAAGLQGNWAGQPRYRRAVAAFRMACSPTRWLVAKGLTHQRFEQVDSPVRRPSPALMRWLVAFAISFHHLPFTYALQAAFCVRAPWTLTLPNWLGPCEARFGYDPGVDPIGCSER